MLLYTHIKIKHNSVYYNCVPGLFNSAIQQSGSAVNTWAFSHNPREIAFKLGDKLDIETTDSAELVAKLAKFSPKELIAASDEVMKTEVCNFFIAFIERTH